MAGEPIVIDISDIYKAAKSVHGISEYLSAVGFRTCSNVPFDGIRVSFDCDPIKMEELMEMIREYGWSMDVSEDGITLECRRG